MSNPSTILMESIKRLLRRNALAHLRKIVDKTHAADLSRVFSSLSLTEQHKLFNMIEDVEQKGILFSELEKDTLLSFVRGLKIEDVVAVLEDMPTDDVADIIGKLPEETVGQDSCIKCGWKGRRRSKDCSVTRTIQPAASWYLISSRCGRM